MNSQAIRARETERNPRVVGVARFTSSNSPFGTCLKSQALESPFRDFSFDNLQLFQEQLLLIGGGLSVVVGLILPFAPSLHGSPGERDAQVKLHTNDAAVRMLVEDRFSALILA